MEAQPGLLDCISENEDAPNTILLIHGAPGTGQDWDQVSPHLSEHHILMPSLYTQHSLELARALRKSHAHSSVPLSWRKTYAKLLSDLILARAKNGRAQVVGLSLGGSIAVALVAIHPDVCQSLLVSGSGTPVNKPTPIVEKAAKLGVFSLERLQDCLSASTIKWLLDNEVDYSPGRWDGHGQKTTFEHVEILVDSTTDSDDRTINHTRFEDREFHVPRKFPVCVVAATRRKWYLPFGDSVEASINLAKLLCEGGRDSQRPPALHVNAKVIEAPDMFHAWNRQDGKIFAECILANISGGHPPQGLRPTWSEQYEI